MKKQKLEGNEWNQIFKKTEEVFRARIRFKERQFSGLMVVKRTEMGHRFAFLTEVGMTMFDLEVGKENFQLHYCFEPLNRKALINLLEKDFRRLVVFGENELAKVFENEAGDFFYKWKLAGEKNFYQTHAQNIVVIYHPSLFPDKAEVEIDYLSGSIGELRIVHKKIGLGIYLSPLAIP